MLNKLTKILVIVCLGGMFLPVISYAQIDIDMSFMLSNELEVSITPNYPLPNETVSMKLFLHTDDLDSADIFWYKDGKVVLSGKGETKYSFKTGLVGQETKIEIRIKLLSGISFSKAFTFNPAGVDLVWEADSYVPPFYRGKALHPIQGRLKVVAVPEFVKNGKRISPKNLIYKWSNGIKVYQDQSGYGKDTAVLNGSLLGRTEKIEVVVTDPVTNLVAQNFVDISPIDPEIVFYENDPYYGYLFESALTNSFGLKSEEVQVLAVPYFFTKEKEGVLKYEWRLNGQSVPNLAGSRTAVFRKPEKETGRSTISLQMTSEIRILQQADAGLTINFEK